MFFVIKITLLASLVRINSLDSHPIFYAVLWVILNLMASLLDNLSQTEILQRGGIDLVGAAIYFHLLNHFDETWLWWLILPLGGFLLIMAHGNLSGVFLGGDWQ